MVMTSVNAWSSACNVRDNRFGYESCLATTLKVEKARVESALCQDIRDDKF